MADSKIKYYAGLSGLITVQLKDSNGVAIDLTGCKATFKLSDEYESKALISEAMNVFEDGKCTISLSPENTDMLNCGRYDMQLIITDIMGNTNGTDRVKISIEKTIE